MNARGALAIDAACVLAFVVVGRRSHDEGEAVLGIARTLAPFAVGLGAGWAVSRAWRRPAALSTGVAVWAVTVAGGLALRAAVKGEGVPISFAVVTAVFLGLCLVGWRAIARAVEARAAKTHP